MPCRGVRGRGRRALHAAHPGARPGAALRRHAVGGNVRRQAGVHRGQAELRIRASDRVAARGPLHRPRLAPTADPLGQRAFLERDPRAVRPAVGGPRRGGWRDVAERRHRAWTAPPTATGSTSAAPTPISRWRSTRTSHRCDRLDVPSLGPAGGGRRHVRPAALAGAHPLVGERDRVGHLLRRHHRTGLARARKWGSRPSGSSACVRR